ncbi:MAG: hypothetical protein ACI8W8_002790 [Rhodothermales bacterium]|jgi:hypothetical protein
MTEHPLALLADAVAANVLLDALETSRRLAELSIPHALIGGLAVGVYGHPRATKDVDFLVGNEAFSCMTPILVYRDELRDCVRAGEIDLMPLPSDHPELSEHLRVPAADEVPVIPTSALVLLKLIANRPQDRADVIALLDVGADVAKITAYLRKHAPDLMSVFAELAQDSASS